MQEVSIREMRQGEETRLSEFIEGVFSKDVAPLFMKQGQAEFRNYIKPASIAERKRAGNHLMLVAETRGKDPELAGIIEVNSYDHISLFFINVALQRKGIGKALLQEAAERSKKKGAKGLTVNSSPNAVAAYERLGFLRLGDERVQNGIRFVPMKKTIAK
jgi:GNAT superfamily N-acetyltransferase